MYNHCDNGVALVIGNTNDKGIAIQYWQRNPDRYTEFITGVKLPWHHKVWVKLCWKKE